MKNLKDFTSIGDEFLSEGRGYKYRFGDGFEFANNGLGDGRGEGFSVGAGYIWGSFAFTLIEYWNL